MDSADDKNSREGIADVYNLIIDLIGIENTIAIYEALRGQQISFPKRFYKTEFVSNEIKRRAKTEKLKDLAREYDYTERYLRRLIGDAEKSSKNE